MKTLAAVLALLLPGLAMAQSPGPDPQQVSENGPPPPEPKKEKSNAFVIEGFVGPAMMSNPDVGGLTYGGAFRFIKRTGLRTDFGILVMGNRLSASGLRTPNAVVFDTEQSSAGGGLELNLGFGISVVDVMFGGGLGLLWINGSATQALGKFEYSNRPTFYLSYGGELGINLGPLRPVLRVTRVVDMEFNPDRAQAGDATGTMVLGGLGVAL